MECSDVDYSNSVVVVTLEVVFPDVAEFLECVDLLACMYVSKAVRSSAGKRLNVISLSGDYETGTQQSMFEGWLEHPDFPFGALIEESLVFERDAQLYRTQVVGSLRHRLLRSFVVLEYNRTYQTEMSRVAVFDPWSSILVAVYNFESNRMYMEDTSRRCRILLKNSGWWCSRKIGECRNSVESSVWNCRSTDISWETNSSGAFLVGGKFVRSNYALFRVYHRVLSPIEVAVVLMHTLSSDVHCIYDYVKALYVQFRWHGPEDVWRLEGEHDSGFRRWHEELLGIE